MNLVIIVYASPMDVRGEMGSDSEKADDVGEASRSSAETPEGSEQVLATMHSM